MVDRARLLLDAEYHQARSAQLLIRAAQAMQNARDLTLSSHIAVEAHRSPVSRSSD